MQTRYVLASDIDDTLTGDPGALHRLARQLEALREHGQLYLILSTGRRLEQVIEGFDAEGIPQCDAVISQVGTEIYLPPFEAGMPPLDAWNRRLNDQFQRDRALRFLDGISGLEMQPDKYNTPLKISAWLDRTQDPESAARTVMQRVADAADGSQVIWSSSKNLDIIPADAGKGKAIKFLLNHQDVNAERVVVAGDSGNDSAMFDEFEYGIIVANAQDELKAYHARHRRPSLYLAGQACAAGVAEGLRKFGVL